MDDIIVTSDDHLKIKRLKMLLARDFDIKDLGASKYFLGMEFTRSRKGIFVSQRKYVLDLLKEIGLMGCVRYCTVFSFIVLLYYESYIYKSNM